MWCSYGPRRTRISSPTWSGRARLVRSPFTCTLPPAIASAASERVLKNLAAHSHLSRRTRPSSASSSAFRILNSTPHEWSRRPTAVPRPQRPNRGGRGICSPKRLLPTLPERHAAPAAHLDLSGTGPRAGARAGCAARRRVRARRAGGYARRGGGPGAGARPSLGGQPAHRSGAGRFYPAHVRRAHARRYRGQPVERVARGRSPARRAAVDRQRARWPCPAALARGSLEVGADSAALRHALAVPVSNVAAVDGERLVMLALALERVGAETARR